MKRPHDNTLLKLAPLSDSGIVVSADGTKQDNAVYTAIQQLVNAFLPCCLDHMFMYNIDFRNVLDPSDELSYKPDVTAVVPMIVTNAALYRLKPSVSDLDAIRSAVKPEDIADLVPWTWCYYEVPLRLFDQNYDAVTRHTTEHAELVYRFPGLEHSMHEFTNRPNWIAVVNIQSLTDVVSALVAGFEALPTSKVETFIAPPVTRRVKGHGKS